MSSKAAKPRIRKTDQDHQKAWRSMRILKHWSVPAVVCTIPGASLDTIGRFVASLVRHGLAEKVPGYVRGRVGDHQIYRLYPKVANDPACPQICTLCDQVISAKVCDPAIKQTHKDEETQRDRETHRTTASAATFAGPELSLAEIEAAELDFYQTAEKPSLPEYRASDYPGTEWHVIPESLKRRLGGAHDAA